jgi:hypothetical protein
LTQLAAPLFEQIVSALDAPESLVQAAAAPQGADPRRRDRRVAVRARVTLIPLTADATLGPGPVEVPLRDLSAGGIGFLHTAKVQLDEHFVALLPDGSGGNPVAVLCQVAYYQPLGERVFAVGAEFRRVLRQPAPQDASPTILAYSAQQHQRRAAS